MEQVVAYIRVSTSEQGDSGLGLEAQEFSIRQFCTQHNLTPAKVFTEVSSGKNGLDVRVELNAAIEISKKLKCRLVVAKLDRLSRSVEFIANLMNSKARFTVCNIGMDADNFQLHIYAVMAEKERTDIGQRTKAALQAKKAREPEWKAGFAGSGLSMVAGELGRAAQTAASMSFASTLSKTLLMFKASGMTLTAIADELNATNTKTARGGKWYAATVSKVLNRIAQEAI